jgi:hypothetical protein
MPDLMKDYEHLKGYETTALMDRRAALLASESDPRKHSDETLQEMLAIARILRTRTVSPKSATGNKRAIAPTLDAL